MIAERTWRKPEGAVAHEGNVVLHVLGLRVRLYVGRSFWPRPRLHPWRWDTTRGVTLRRSRATPGRGGCRVLGVQWRPLDAREVRAPWNWGAPR